MRRITEKGLSRRSFLRIMAAGTTSAMLGPLGAAETAKRPSERKPNIVFVFSDEHRWCSMPISEAPEVVAPNMQRMAREGLCIDNCISNNPVCVPYRGMLVTGRWPFDSKFISNDFVDNIRLPEYKDMRTIAHTFKEGGYLTGYVGKWHLIEDSVYYAGFDYHKHWLFGDDHWDTKHRDVPSREGWKVYKNYNAIGMTDQALDFMKANAEGDKPFMLMLSLNPPHWRWDDAPEEFVKLYPVEERKFRTNVAVHLAQRRDHLSAFQHYLAHITAVDRELGRIMDTLDELGIAEETILIYTSDHGSMFHSHGLFSKPAGPYDETHRVPFLIRQPGTIPAGKRVDAAIGAIDLYPTLCGLAGIKPPDYCGGKDLASIVLGAGGPEPESQLLLHAHSTVWTLRATLDPDTPNWHPFYRGVRTKRYTYAVQVNGEVYLFDNLKDPYQMKNLKDDPEYADVKADLHSQLERLLKVAEDPFIPAELRDLPLIERMEQTNLHFTRVALTPYRELHKKSTLEPYLASDSEPARAKELSEAYERVLGWEFFMKYYALERKAREASQKNDETEAEKIKAEAAEFNKQSIEAFSREVKQE